MMSRRRTPSDALKVPDGYDILAMKRLKNRVTKDAMLEKLFPAKKSVSPVEQDDYQLEEYLENASLSLSVAVKQLQYASIWLRKYKAEVTDVDILIETLKIHAEELKELQQRYQ